VIGEIFIFLILLSMSAFFSSAETAILSLNNLTLKSIVGKNSVIVKHYQRILITILIGNNLVNIGMASLATYIAYSLFPNYAVGVATFLTTLIVLIFGEIFPKSIALKHNKYLVEKYAPFLVFFYYLFLPFTLMFEKFAKLLRFNISEAKIRIDKEDFEEVVEQAHDEGIIDGEDKEIIQNILEYTHKKARDVMIPLNHVKRLNKNLKKEDALEKVVKFKYSRYPVYDKKPSNIVGMVHIKDILSLENGEKIEKVIRKILKVQEDEEIDAIMRKMKKEKTHLALIMRKNKPVGIITLEEIIEELFGEIEDEIV